MLHFYFIVSNHIPNSTYGNTDGYVELSYFFIISLPNIKKGCESFDQCTRVPPPNPFKWCPTFLGQIVCFTHHEVHNRVSKLPAIPNVASDGIPLKVTQLWWLRLWYFRLSPMITEVIFSHCCKTEIIKPQGKRSLSCPRSTQSSPSRIGICTFSKGGTVNSQYHKGQQCFIRSCRSHRRRMFGFFFNFTHRRRIARLTCEGLCGDLLQ